MIESAFPILEVSDMDAALSFYRDAFGGVLTYSFPPEGEPVYVSLAVGASSLGIGLAEAPPRRATCSSGSTSTTSTG